jgi:hypothetical protein
MMLAASLLSASQAVAAVFSPSRVNKLASQCKKLVAPSRYRYDPYSVSVLPVALAPSPLHQAQAVNTPAPAPVEVTVQAAAKAPAPTAAPTGPRYAIIRFKYETATFLAPFRIVVGDTVVVEGDRGENIGVVAEIGNEKPSYDVSSKVIRRATDKDREAFASQRQREAAIVKTTQQLADNLGLHASIEDAEYQFDLNKLTIFVRRSSAKTFVDFRKLQRSLFREFRCRIWCAYMDEVEAAEKGPRTR